MRVRDLFKNWTAKDQVTNFEHRAIERTRFARNLQRLYRRSVDDELHVRGSCKIGRRVGKSLARQHPHCALFVVRLIRSAQADIIALVGLDEDIPKRLACDPVRSGNAADILLELRVAGGGEKEADREEQDAAVHPGTARSDRKAGNHESTGKW